MTEINTGWKDERIRQAYTLIQEVLMERYPEDWHKRAILFKIEALDEGNDDDD